MNDTIDWVDSVQASRTDEVVARSQSCKPCRKTEMATIPRAKPDARATEDVYHREQSVAASIITSTATRDHPNENTHNFRFDTIEKQRLTTPLSRPLSNPSHLATFFTLENKTKLRS
jgi:hypothetical protein